MAYPNINQAQKIVGKMATAPIGKATLPKGQLRIYPVAMLAPGKLLLSDGSIRQTPLVNKLNDLNKQKALEGQLTPPNNNPQKYIDTLSLNIAIPAQQTGDNTGTTTPADAFLKYLNQILQPQMQAAPEMGLPALVPNQLEQNDTGGQVSALANLPQLIQAPESQMQSESFRQYQNIANFISRFRDNIAQQFARQSIPGETETNSFKGFNLPLVQGYGTSYRLPSQANAQYAQVGGNPFILTDGVR